MKIKTERTFMLSQKEFNMMIKAINWYNDHATQLNELDMGDLDLYEIFDRILTHCKINDNDCGDDEYNDCDDYGDDDDYDDDDDCDDDYDDPFDDYDDGDCNPFDDDEDDDDCGDCDEFDTERIERIVRATDDWDEIFNEIINGD